MCVCVWWQCFAFAIELAYFTQYFPAKLNAFIYLYMHLFACIFANTFKWKYACKQIASSHMHACMCLCAVWLWQTWHFAICVWLWIFDLTIVCTHTYIYINICVSTEICKLLVFNQKCCCLCGCVAQIIEFAKNLAFTLKFVIKKFIYIHSSAICNLVFVLMYSAFCT